MFKIFRDQRQFRLYLSLLTVLLILTASCNLIKPPSTANVSTTTSPNSKDSTASVSAPNSVKATKCNKISILLPETNEAERYEGSDRPELERQIAKRLIDKKVDDLMLLYFNANGNAKTQIDQAELAFKQGVCLLIVDPSKKSINIEIVKMANKKGIPVIAYDRILEEGNDYAPYFVSFDTIKVGEYQGQYIAEQVNKLGSQYQFQLRNNKYVMINGDKEDNNTSLLVKGFKNSLQPLIDTGVIKPVKLEQQEGITEQEEGIWYSLGWDETLAANKMSEVLNENPDLKIAWVGNDKMAIAIINKINSLKPDQKGKILITGQDGTKESLNKIKNGEQSMTVCKDSKDLAKKTAILVEELFDGKNPKSERIDGFDDPNIVYRISKEIHPVSQDNMKYPETVNSCLKMLGINDPNDPN
jgi:ABC-type xylose transport system, periplasmic component